MMPLNYRRIVHVLSGMAATAAVAAVYAWQIEPRWVEYVHRPLPVRHLPQRLNGRTLVQLSDLHVGGAMPLSHFHHHLRRVQALQPDFVVYTGDFIAFYEGSDAQFAELCEVLKEAPKGKLGTAAILGNHDYGRGWNDLAMADRVVACVEAAGIPVLRNDLQHFAGLCLAGLEEMWSANYQPEALIKQLDPAVPTILLCHNPDIIDQPIWGNYQVWVLSGHTHGGQIKIPFLSPFVNPTNNKQFISGAFQTEQGQQLYINRGLGHSFPFRFGSRPEVTVFTLQAV